MSDEFTNIVQGILILVILAVLIIIWTGIILCCIYACPPISEQSLPPVQVLTGVVITSDKDLLNECSICLSEFKGGDQMRVLDCGHYYHKDCVDNWLQRKNTCPKCRGENV